MKIIICDDSIKEAEKTKEVLVSNQLADESDITIFCRTILGVRSSADHFHVI